MRDRTQTTWRKKTFELWEHCIYPVIDELQEYWPLTVRQIHYQLVSKFPERYPNNTPSYNKLIRTLTVARLQDMSVNGYPLWDAIEDRSRSWTSYRMWENSRLFLQEEVDKFMRVESYTRNRMQGQEVHLQIWLEKDALSGVFKRVTGRFGVPLIAARGYSSVSFAHECRLEALRQYEVGKHTLLLYFGDCDPSGWDMPEAMMTTLRDEMNLASIISSERVALLPRQVFNRETGEYLYPPSIVKDTDTRTAGYRQMLAEQGYPTNLAVELDAIPPSELEEMIQASIKSHIDMDVYDEVISKEDEDTQRLGDIRVKAMRALRDIVNAV